MTYRVFSRDTWRANPSWPNGYEPNAVPMDTCRTLAEFDTTAEAIEYCDEHNDKWRKHSDHITYKTASPTQIKTYYTASRYEWTERRTL